MWISLIASFWGLKCSSVLCISYKFVVESQDFIRFWSEFLFGNTTPTVVKCSSISQHFICSFCLCLIPYPFFLYWDYIPSTQVFMLLLYRHVSINSLFYITITAYLWYHKWYHILCLIQKLTFPTLLFFIIYWNFYFIHFNRHLVSQNINMPSYICFQFS